MGVTLWGGGIALENKEGRYLVFGFRLRKRATAGGGMSRSEGRGGGRVEPNCATARNFDLDPQ